MATFGQPTRTPIKDAQSGNIVAPKKSIQAVQASTRNPNEGYQSDVLNKGVQSIAMSLGEALGAIAEDVNTGINAQKTLDAAMRQGQQQGINEADADNKRTGWKKAIFGQDAGYIEAQRRAATNAVRASGVETSANMVTHAGTPPNEFMDSLADQKTELLEKYEDAETRLLVSEMFDKQAVGLARTHQKEFEGYTQLQNKETSALEMQLIVDQANVDGASGISTPEAGNRLIMEPMNGIFSHSSKPTNMEDSAYQQVIVETLATNLSQGNVSFYRAADNMGYLSKLSKKQQSTLDRAKRAYEVKLEDEAAYIVEDIQSQALDAESGDEVEAIYAIGLEKLNDVDMRHPDLSFKAKKGLKTQLSEAKGNRFTYMQRFKALEKEKQRDIVKATKKEVELETAKDNKNSLRVSMRGGVSIPLSKKEGTIALDGILMDDINRVTGSESLTPREASGKILIDDKANKQAVRSWKQTTHSSAIVDATLQAYVNSDLNQMVDEKGKLLPEAIEQLGMIERFKQANPKKFAKSLGTTGYAHYLMKQRGINAGQTIDRINKDIDAYDQNKLAGNDTYIAPVMDGKNVSKVNFVTDFLNSEVAKPPESRFSSTPSNRVTSASISESLQIFNDGLTIHKGDAEAAKQYTLDIVRNSAEIVTLTGVATSGEEYESSFIIQGASAIQNELSTPLSELINYAEGKDGFAKAIEGLLGDTSVLDKKNQQPLTKLSQVQNLDIYTIQGYDGIFLNTPSSPNPFEITLEQLQDFDQRITRGKQQDALDKENAKLAERKERQTRKDQILSGQRRE